MEITPHSAGSRRLRVLLAEPHKHDGQRLLRVLQGCGYLVQSRFVTTSEALATALSDADWDVVLLAGSYANETLNVFLQQLRAHDPQLPVICTVERDAATLPANLLHDGVCDFVLKSNPTRLLGVIERECGAAKKTEVTVDGSEARFLQLARNIPECYWLTNLATGQVTYVNKAYEQIWGRHVEELYNDPRDGLKYVHADDLDALRAAFTANPLGGLDARFRVVRPGEQTRWLHARTFPVHDEKGNLVSIGGIATDVSEAFSGRRDQIRLAHFDSLTALPNQLMFYDQARQQIALARRKKFPLAIMLIDLDHFRELNQTLGHVAGDELLCQVAGRLSGSLRESDILGRLGADTFAALLPDVSDIQQAGIVARRISDTLIQPIRVEDQDVFATASMGIVFYPQDGNDAHELLSNAETAVRHAKKQGRNNYQAYMANMQVEVRNRLFLEIDLRNALLNEEFLLYYQPKVSCIDGRIIGVEALLRWKNPQRGLVAPDQFIPLLEETGLILPVGRWVLREACRQTVAWQNGGLDIPSVSVNLSARQLESETLLREVELALAESGLPASCLDLEITESMLMHNAETSVRLLGELKTMGVTLSIDDFGTGYSSLAYLKRFPIDTVKVDRSFVQDIAADADDASITRAVITMAHHLKLKVVAEGVETAEQLALLISHQCDAIQGYFFSRPLPAADLAALFASGKRLPGGMLRSPTYEPLVLFVAVNGADETMAQLRADGHRVESVPDCLAAQPWLNGNQIDVIVCSLLAGDAEIQALLKQATQAQAWCEPILLVDADRLDSPVVAEFGFSGRGRLLRHPVTMPLLRQTIEDILSRRQVVDEHQRLQQEIEVAERQLLRSEEERASLANENLRLKNQEALAARVLADVVRELPWPVLGVDDENVLVMANDLALASLGDLGFCLGLPLAECLPMLDTAGEGEKLTVAGRIYAVYSRPVQLGATASGRLLLLEEQKT